MSDRTSQPRRTVLYVSEICPVPTHASALVMHRHLRALEREGYDIQVVTLDDASSRDLPASWRVIRLPMRKAYYPPYRTSRPLRTIRWLLLDRIVQPLLPRERPHCVLGLLHGEYLAHYAAWIAAKLPSPLYYFYHDRGEHLLHGGDPAAATAMTNRNLKLIAAEQVRRVWPVSDELIYDVPGIREKFRTLYPLPERLPDVSQPAWHESFAHTTALVHSGTIYNEIVPALRMIAGVLAARGGKLLLTSPRIEVAGGLAKEFPGTVDYLGDIPDMRQLAQLIRGRASAFLVVYPPDSVSMPWSNESFPSKFVQLAQTRLPGVIMAPANTSVSRWCVRHQWKLHTTQVDQDSLMRLLARLRTKEEWVDAVGDSSRAASGDFNPSVIENIVSSEIQNP